MQGIYMKFVFGTWDFLVTTDSMVCIEEVLLWRCFSPKLGPVSELKLFELEIIVLLIVFSFVSFEFEIFEFDGVPPKLNTLSKLSIKINFT